MEITKEKFKEIEKEFNNNAKTKTNFRYIKGKRPIILSAPHSVRQNREGKIKGKEFCTGSIAILLQRELNCFCIYKQKNCNDDVGYDIFNNKYRYKIMEEVNNKEIQFLLDIHGAKDKYGFDIDVGTNNLRNLNGHDEYINDFLRIGEKYNLNITVDKQFKADTYRTISNSVALVNKIPCLQIEISKEYRNIRNFSKIKLILNFLEEYLKSIELGGKYE